MLDITQIVKIYDTLISSAKKELEKQFNDGRITRNNYANILLDIMKEAMNLAFNAPSVDTDIKIKEKQLELLEGDLELKKEQIKDIVASRILKEIEKDKVSAEMIMMQKDIELKEAQKQVMFEEIKQSAVKTKLAELDAEMKKIQSEIAKGDIKLKDLQLNEEKERIALLNAQRLSEISRKMLTDAQVNYQYEQTKLIPEQLAKLRSEKCLTDRQIKGFDDNLLLKLMQTQFNTWGISFSSGLLEDTPSVVTDREMRNTYNELKERIGTCLDCYDNINIALGCNETETVTNSCPSEKVKLSYMQVLYCKCQLFGDNSCKLYLKLNDSLVSECDSSIEYLSNGTIEYIDGKSGKAIHPADNDSYIYRNDNLSGNQLKTNTTGALSLFVKWDGTSDNDKNVFCARSLDSNGGQSPYYIYLNWDDDGNHRWRAVFKDSQGNDIWQDNISSAIDDKGKWVHWVIQQDYQNNKIYFYKNCEKVGEYDGHFDGTDDLYLSGYADGVYCDIDNVRTFDRLLTDDEIKSLSIENGDDCGS